MESFEASWAGAFGASHQSGSQEDAAVSEEEMTAEEIVARFRFEMAQEKAARELELAGNLEWKIQQLLTEDEWKLFRSWIGKNKDLLKNGR